MSENQEASAIRAEETVNQENRFDPMAALPAHGEKKIEGKIQDTIESLDGQSHFLGEVTQNYLVDPQALLPLNSDQLIGMEGGDRNASFGSGPDDPGGSRSDPEGAKENHSLGRSDRKE